MLCLPKSPIPQSKMAVENEYFFFNVGQWTCHGLEKPWTVHGSLGSSSSSLKRMPSDELCNCFLASGGEVSQWYAFLQHSYSCTWLLFITNALLALKFSFQSKLINSNFWQSSSSPSQKYRLWSPSSSFHLSSYHLRLLALFMHYISSLTKSVFPLNYHLIFILNFPFTCIHIQVKPWSSLIETFCPHIQYTLIKIIFLVQKYDHISSWI